MNLLEPTQFNLDRHADHLPSHRGCSTWLVVKEKIAGLFGRREKSISQPFEYFAPLMNLSKLAIPCVIPSNFSSLQKSKRECSPKVLEECYFEVIHSWLKQAAHINVSTVPTCGTTPIAITPSLQYIPHIYHIYIYGLGWHRLALAL